MANLALAPDWATIEAAIENGTTQKKSLEDCMRDVVLKNLLPGGCEWFLATTQSTNVYRRGRELEARCARKYGQPRA